MLLMAAGGLLVVLVCVDMGIKQYIEENFEEEEEREKVDVPEFLVRKFWTKLCSGRFIIKASVLIHWIRSRSW